MDNVGMSSGNMDAKGSQQHGAGKAPLAGKLDDISAGRLVLGTDFPYEAGDVFVRAIDYISDPRFTQHEANAILQDNATALFGVTTPASSTTA